MRFAFFFSSFVQQTNRVDRARNGRREALLTIGKTGGNLLHSRMSVVALDLIGNPRNDSY